MAAVGIDLGTTQCRVAVFQHGKIEILSNEQGSICTPSYVAFTDTDRYIGGIAKSQLSLNLSNTIYDCKRLMGRQFMDKIVQSDLKQLPFSVCCVRDKPRVQVKYKGINRCFSPEEISAMMLQRMRGLAEAHLGVAVLDVVVSVPAHFNDAQRRATIEACAIADLRPLRLLNDTTASALAYGVGRKVEGEKFVLIYDLGGGGFDVSVVSIDDGIFEVLSIFGDSHLGGRDFDDRVANYLVAEFHHRFQKDLRSNRKAMCRVRTASERAKCELSTSKGTMIELDSLFEGIDFYTSLTRAQFEDLNQDLFNKTLSEVENALKCANKTSTNIHEVVLVGGSTRIPMIQRMLKDMFGGRELSRSANPDGAVAHGAAVQAAILQRHGSVKDILVQIDVTAHSLGVEFGKGIMSRIITRNSSIPNKRFIVFTAHAEQSHGIRLRVYEGEEKLVKDNRLIGQFQLGGLPTAPRGVLKVEVTFHVSINGILTLTAADKTKDKIELDINCDAGYRLSDEEIKKMRDECEIFRVEDFRQRDRVGSKNRLEGYALEVRSSLYSTGMCERDRVKALAKIDKALAWIDSTQSSTKEDIDGVYYELVKACKSLRIV